MGTEVDVTHARYERCDRIQTFGRKSRMDETTCKRKGLNHIKIGLKGTGRLVQTWARNWLL